MELSIIVPVYNAEKVLPRCLDSIMKVSGVDWECILVNDGSQDQSAEIITAYTQRDSRFIAVHVPNGGVSSARNIGLARANGRLCMFLDADDWLSESAGELLSKEIVSFQPAQLTVFAYQTVNSTGQTEDKLYPVFPKDCSYGEQLKALVIRKQTLNHCWGKLYSREILEQHQIRFHPAMKIGEDACFVMEYLKHVTGIRICNVILLHYWMNPKGAMGSIRLRATVDMKETLAARKALMAFFAVPMSTQESAVLYSYYAYAFLTYALNECAFVNRQVFVEQLQTYMQMDYVQEFVNGTAVAALNRFYKLFFLLLRKKQFTLLYMLMKLVRFIKGN